MNGNSNRPVFKPELLKTYSRAAGEMRSSYNKMTRNDLVGCHKGDGKEDKLITSQQSIRPAERSKTDFLNTSDRLGSTI